MNDPLDFSHFENAYNNRQQERGLNLRFYEDAIEDKRQSLEAGRPIYVKVHYVAINVPGSRDEIVKKVGEIEKQRFGAQYQHWLNTQEQPVEGTPLDLVPFLNIAQVKEMAALNVKTLEQLAALSDTAVQKIGMGGSELRKKALAYMDAAKGSAELQRYVTRISELERENARLQEAIKQVNERYEAVMKMAPAPVAPAPQLPAFDVAALVKAEIAKAMEGLKT